MVPQLNLTDCDDSRYRRAIRQGSSWGNTTLLCEKDLRGFTLKGEIRNNFREEGGEILGAFSFAPVEFRQISFCLPNSKQINALRSIVLPKLSAIQTSALGTSWKKRKMRNRKPLEPAIIDTNVWVYDFRADMGEESIRICEGWLEIVMEVTAK